MHAPSRHSARQHRTVRRGIEAVSITSDRQFPRHAHDEYGLGVLDRGAHRTWSAIGQVEAIANDVITVNPGEMHDGAPVDGRSRAWRMLYLDPDLVYAEICEEHAGSLEIVRPVVGDPALRLALNRLFAMVTSATTPALALEETLLRILMRVSSHHSVLVAARHGASPEIARARQRLDDAPEVPTSLSCLAAAEGISRFQLLRGFAREVGVTPYAYQLQCRVRLARRLIAAGRPLSDVAAASGFSDQSHMTRIFVRQLGVTPARYRDAVGLA